MSETKEDEDKKCSEAEESLGGPKFYPCLYIQRYLYVKKELAKFNVKSLVDFGSAECKIIRFLVQIPTLEQLSLVDLDGDLLESKKYQIRPLTSEYLLGLDMTLDVNLYQGDITNPDERLKGSEAVSMVEIIEHLHPPVLEAAVTAVFGQIRPRVAVVTTPNSDYNQLFPNFSGFRHWDHKFEWTQAEFRKWCEGVCSCYGYQVTYGGVGEPPPGSEYLGYCSQAATFTRCSDSVAGETDSFSNGYRLILKCTYPCKLQSNLPEDEQTLQELAYRVRQFTVWSQKEIECMCENNRNPAERKTDSPSDKTVANQVKISLNDIMQNVDENESKEISYEEIARYQVKYGFINKAPNVTKNQFEHGSRNDSSGNLVTDRTAEMGGDANKSFDKDLCYLCKCVRYGVEESECLVPVTYLMVSKAISSKFDTGQLRSFLQHHGYKLTEDQQCLVVDYENYDDDDHYNYYDDSDTVELPDQDNDSNEDG